MTEMATFDRQKSNTASLKDEEILTDKQFQKCLDACGFGKYQCLLLLAASVAVLANVSVSAKIPFLLAYAECDLEMNLVHKGFLNAVPYLGMISSGFLAGFLTDTFGRKKTLLICYAGMTLFIFIAGSSQNYETLVMACFMEGFLFNGAFSANMALQAEFQTSKSRDRVMVMLSAYIASSHVLISLLAWGVLPRDWILEIFSGSFVLRSWNFFIYINGFLSLAACLIYFLFPDSPKYDFAHGRYKEALCTLRKVYAINTGKSPDTFPYKNIGLAGKQQKKSLKEQVRSSWADIKVVFRKPLVNHLVLIISIQMMLMLGYNTMRLWYPQISTILESHVSSSSNSTDLCSILDSYVSTTSETTQSADCVPTTSGNQTYINSIIMGLVGIVPYFITGLFINFGKKLMLLISLCSSCGCALALYWTTTSFEVVSLFSAYVALGQVSISLIQATVVAIFPTSAKTVTISMVMMSGRLGTLLGNTLFPVLLAQGCQIPFFTIAAMMACLAFLALFLPKSS